MITYTKTPFIMPLRYKGNCESCGNDLPANSKNWYSPKNDNSTGRHIVFCNEAGCFDPEWAVIQKQNQQAYRANKKTAAPATAATPVIPSLSLTELNARIDTLAKQVGDLWNANATLTQRIEKMSPTLLLENEPIIEEEEDASTFPPYLTKAEQKEKQAAEDYLEKEGEPETRLLYRTFFNHGKFGALLDQYKHLDLDRNEFFGSWGRYATIQSILKLNNHIKAEKAERAQSEVSASN